MAAGTAKSATTVTESALLSAILWTRTLGEHGFQYLRRGEHLLETSVITFLYVQPLLYLLHLRLLLLEVFLYALRSLLVSQLLLSSLVLHPVCSAPAPFGIGGKHLCLILCINSKETVTGNTLQAKGLGQALTGLGYQLGALGITPFARLCILGNRPTRCHQAQSHKNQQFLHLHFFI